MNPITSLSKQLQNLINEHGSATILKERVALFKEQVADLEKKNSGLQIDIKQLRTHNRNLKTKCSEQLNIINELTNSANSHVIDLEDIQIKILMALSESGKLVKGISQTVTAGKEVIKYHLKELEILNMVKFELVPMVDDMWFLRQKGRGYLIKNMFIT